MKIKNFGRINTGFTTTFLLLLSLPAMALSPLEEIGSYPQYNSRPNILLILADDLGYSDVGAFGGEIKTPAIDQLAAEGLRLSNFHVLPTCSPTRSVLFSGIDNHLVGLGTMGELRTPAMDDNAGYLGHLNFQVAALPELLQASGYRTYIAGKWHLGGDRTTNAFSRGFEQSFALLPAGGSHWNDKKPLSPPLSMVYSRNGEIEETLPESYYSSRYFTEQILGWLKNSDRKDKPFFAYLSFTAPHNPLHAPKAYIDKYRGVYDGGWDKLRKKRLQSLQRLGLVNVDTQAFPRLPFVPAWNSLSEEKRQLFSRDMEVYAAMVHYMDEQILRVISYLREAGQYDNTMIVFMSDNGANGSPHTSYPQQTLDFLSSFDNSLENRGLKNSYVDMGAGWAQASMAPSRLFKGFTSEGGIKAPLIVKLPGAMSNSGHISGEFVSVRDIMPTLLEVADVKPGDSFGSRKIIPMQGQSILPLLSGASQKAYKGSGKLGLELFGTRAFIDWPWKILKLPPPFGKSEWQLYNLESDPGETQDLSEKNPEKRAKMQSLWREYKNNNNILDISLNMSSVK